MNNPVQWQERNNEYLAAAVARVRARLETQSNLLETEPVAEGKTFQRRSSGNHSHPKEAEQLGSVVVAAGEMSPPPALLILSQRLGLSEFEREILILCASVELDTRIAPLCARAQGDPHRPYPTFALAMALFDDPAWEVLSPERPLRYWRLIEINQPGAQPLTTSPLRIDERILNYVKGLNYLDDRLKPLLIPFDIAIEIDDFSGDSYSLPPSQQAISTAIGQSLQQATVGGRFPIIQLVGPDVTSKQMVAVHAAAQLGLSLFRLPAESIPSQADELETLIRLWERESTLLPIALYLDAQEIDVDTDPAKGAPAGASPLRRFLTRSQGIIFLSIREAWPGSGLRNLIMDVDKPTSTEQRAAWTAVLGEDTDNLLTRLAGQFNLNLPTIQQVARSGLGASPNGKGELRERIWNACLARTRPRLDFLAQRIEAKATWDDIVLPETELGMLRRICEQVEQRSKVYDDWGFRRKMNRGLGISALFAGESGTGKTMAAEVIANDLRLNLYHIDLSAVVSKYIGETEKNLRRLFDAAEDGGTILFFDEADALFGKRSEVKDSHDRYANIEINYLLQRMEAYGGLAVLATNMKSALDHAFLRRLRFIVNFPFPDRDSRARIWRKVIPPELPVEDLDYDHLSRLNLTGGGIHNIILSAAFMAASARVPVSMPLLLEAARGEFRKMGVAVNEGLLRWREQVGSSQFSVDSIQQ